MISLSELVATYFPEERVKLQLHVSLKDRWVGVWRFAFFPSWYPVPVEMIQTGKFLFFDRRRANIIKAGVYGVISAVLTFLFVTLFFGYFSVLWIGFSLVVAILIFIMLSIGGRSLTFGVIAIHIDWLERVSPKSQERNSITLNGRKPPDFCRSIVCAMEIDSREELSVVENVLLAMDIGPVYEMFGWMDWFEVKYRAVE